MLKKCIALILVVICLNDYSSATGTDETENQNKDIFPAMTSVPPVDEFADHSPRPCRPMVNCPHIGKPVCTSVNGLPLTAPTRCHYDSKVRCYPQVLEQGERMPIFRFIHEGPCTETDDEIMEILNNLPKTPL